MIRQGTPYSKSVHPSNDDVSDVDLYEEARLLSHERYEVVPRAPWAPDIVKAKSAVRYFPQKRAGKRNRRESKN